MTDEKKLPQGRLGRLARLATVGLRTGTSLLLDRDERENHAHAARHAAEVLGTLRGLAAKVGQMAGYIDGIVPDSHRDAYGVAMQALQAAAASSPPATVRATVEAELGAPLDALFAEWSEAPIASASIGQVHRAVLHDGREVAVKVQHAGVARALESDLANAGILESMVGGVGGLRKLNSKAILETLRTRFREELDYALEAERMTKFRAMHARDPRVHVPAVVPERSSARVLTSEFVRGARFDEAVAAPEADRRAWAETMWRFVFRGNLTHGLFNADPHPGNYVFHPEGRVTFLDFGCVQAIPPSRRAEARALHRAAMLDDEARFLAATDSFLGTRPGRLGPPARAYVRACFQPLFGSPYRMTRPFAASLVSGMREMAVLARSLPESEIFQFPAEMTLMNRLQFGFYSVLARLDIEVDYRAIERGFWPDVQAMIDAGA